jgi:hypothetical protein
MSLNDNDLFVAPERISLSLSARDLALAYALKVNETSPDRRFLVVFDWADERRARQKGTNNWHDLGPGLDLVAYHRSQVPAPCVVRADDFEFAVKIPAEVLPRKADILIDVDGTVPHQLVLK